MGFKRDLLCGVATFAMLTSVAQADEFLGGGNLPAVSGPNGKLAGFGGLFDDDGRGGVSGSYTVPLGHAFGFQADGMAASYGGDFAGGVAGHLFTRDPDSYLFGIQAMYQGVGSNDVMRIGPELELYLGQFSVEFTGGYEDSDSNGDEFFASGDLAFYVQDNFRINAGYRRTISFDMFQFGAEWMPGVNLGFGPASLYAKAQVGDGNYESFWAGIRFYFGDPDKSLIRRHREDDPEGDLVDLTREPDEECPPVFGIDGIYTCTPPTMKTPPPS
jgi:hypothetical protein